MKQPYSIITRLALFAAVVLSCLLLSACAPTLSLNPKYTYTSFDLELGDELPCDIGEYVDLSGMSDEDVSFVRENTEILVDGEPADNKISSAGDHVLTLRYCGRQYRQYNVTVTDKESPVFTRVTDIYTFEGIPVNEDEIPGMFEAEDNSGEVKVRVKYDSIDYDRAGKYTVRATAKDPSGNKTKAKAHIIVQKPEYGAVGTYVFVSVGKQHLTYFVDGKPVMDCPVVTGNILNGHGTPHGTFSLNYKSRNVILRGTEDNGDKYESFVNYWMAFIGTGYGLHDATWRSSFGGSIYRGAGSHGCVNMPYASAAELYDLIEPGTPVLVY